MFRCSGLFRAVAGCSGMPVLRYSGVPVSGFPVFRDVPGCSGLFRCSGVPVFQCSGVPCSDVHDFSTFHDKVSLRYKYPSVTR